MAADSTPTAIVGIDVSKRKVDLVLLRADKLKHKSLSNDVRGFEALLAWLHK